MIISNVWLGLLILALVPTGWANFYLSSTAAEASFTNCAVPPNAGVYAANCFVTNCVAGDPQFVDLLINNVRLRATSPCVNSGVNRSWMDGTKDMDGISRIDGFCRRVDIGAYELLMNGTLWSAR